MASIIPIIGGLTAGVVALGGGAVVYAVATAPPAGPDRASVVKVIDGDTIDVRYDGTEHRIRLLNVDTPETKDPNKAVECLGPEATDFLKQQLEPGDRVRLEFDQERLDKYDRELAGVFEDDVLINAEIARRGLGIPVLFEPNRLFYDEVVAAFEEGKAAQVGVFDPSLPCTFASRVDSYADQVNEAEAEPSPEAIIEAADEAVDQGNALLELIDHAEPHTLSAAGMTGREHKALRKQVASLQDRAAATGKKAAAEIKAEAKRKAEAKAKKAAAKKKAEAKRKAEAEAQRQAEEQRQAEQAAAEEAARRQQEAPPAPSPEPSVEPAPEPPAPSRPGAGYTGCRAYIGGPYIDDQGRSYTPIDCTTREPLPV